MENIKGKNNISRISMCNFITLNVNDLTNLERQDILQIIFNTVDSGKIHDKGDGVIIKMEYIPTPVLTNIYDFIQKKLILKKKQIEYFPEDEKD